MRRVFVIILVAMLALTMAACGQKSSPGGAGGSFSYEKIAFEKVEPGQEPAEIAKVLEQMRAEADTKVLALEGMTYVLITAGEKSSGGWDVVVTGVGDANGRIEVQYQIREPKPGSVNTAAITYPSVVVRFKNPGLLAVDVEEIKEAK